VAQPKRKADTLPLERSKRRQQASTACSRDHLEESITETNLRLQNFIPNRSISGTIPVLSPSVMKEPHHTTRHSTDSSIPLLPETFIPPLFYAMGGRVPKIMIDRATSPQRRLSESGDAFEFQPHNAGLHQDLVDILSDREELLRGIERLILLSTIAVETSSDVIGFYTCQCESAQISFDLDPASWTHRAFELCCYVFPRNRAIEPL
jgi:hypothetical protein